MLVLDPRVSLIKLLFKIKTLDVFLGIWNEI